MNRTSPALRATFASLALLGLAGCGGGVYLELTDPYGPPPSISIAASTDVAARGEVIRLVGAVTAANGIDRVTFYRIDGNVSTSLGVLHGPPAQIDTPIPLNAGRSVGYWARVCDVDGRCGESPTITVSVVP